MKNPLITVSPQAEEVTKDLPALISQDQAAEFLRVSTRTIRRWSRSGKLPCYRTAPAAGGKVLISRLEISKLLDRMRVIVPFEER